MTDARTIHTLRLVGVIFYRGVSDSRFLKIEPDSYREDERGLFLFDTDSDVFVPWTSVLAITYGKRPAPLHEAIQKALPPTLDAFLEDQNVQALTDQPPPAKPPKKGGKREPGGSRG